MSQRPGRDDARAVALDVLVRCERQGAYANLALPAALERSNLDERDRAFATQLVYGTLRMARACDFLVDRFLVRDIEPEVRAVLRLGAFQLAFLGVAPHAAVSATVEVAPKRVRGLVNAVLRRVSDHPIDPDALPVDGGWPDLATRLSYPDWIVERLIEDLGPADAEAALEAMNEPARVHERADGYVQDPASQRVVALVDADEGEWILDLCAAPGGKATGLAASGAHVVAVDLHPQRVGLIAANAARTGTSPRVHPVAADGTRPAWRAGSFDRVLVDAPCSGIGSLRRRPDARWRIDAAGVDRLVALQRDLVTAAAHAVRPGGTLVVSVCTLLDAETVELDRWIASVHPELEALPAPEAPWRAAGRGARLLPQDDGTDGMAVFRYRRVEPR